MSWMGLSHKGTEPLYSDEWNKAVDALDILYGYVSGKLDKSELLNLDSDIIPGKDNTYDLGSEVKQWKEIHAHYGYFSDQVYVQGKAVLKDGDPVQISAFIGDAKADVEKFYSLHQGIKEDTAQLDIPLSQLRSKIEEIYGIVKELNQKIARQVLQMDDGAIVQDTRFADRIEQGRAFSASHRFEDVPSDGQVSAWFENPTGSNKVVNIVVVEAVGLGAGFIDIYHGNTKVSSGTKIPVINLNMAYPNDAVAIPEYGGSYTPGKIAHQTVLPGGTKINAIGSMAEVGERLKMWPGYNILIVLTNKAGTTSSYSIRFLWFEDLMS